VELTEAMRTTGAVREFTDEPLSDEVLHRILDSARFAPSGGNRQGVRVIVLRDAATRDSLAELTVPGARRYWAQTLRGEVPWNPLTPCGASDDEVAALDLPDMFISPVRSAAVVLVLCLDLSTVAATDQNLDRIGVVSGASVYPLAWNILLAARELGFGGTFTTMAVPKEGEVRGLLGIPDDWALAAVMPLGRPVHQVSRLKRHPVADFVVSERFDGVPFSVPREADETPD
jgi:nitroreductase